MRDFVYTLLLATFVVLLVVPAILVRGCARLEGPKPVKGVEVSLLVTKENKILKLPLEEYVSGVVAAEMPASFELEALKAQAVAARTYVIGRMRNSGGSGCSLDPRADVCDDPAHDQAWLSRRELRKRWGLFGYYRYWRRIQAAVRATEGLVVKYDSVPIDPLYHSTCGGMTENAEDVWGTEIPYLKSVSCKWDTSSPRFSEEKELKVDEMLRLLGFGEEAIRKAQKKGNGVIAVTERTKTGRVKKVDILGKSFTGPEIRAKLGLNSTNFTWKVERDVIRFRTVGFGHGVGMCQYGANGMAKEGRDFKAILQYYYQGVTVEKTS